MSTDKGVAVMVSKSLAKPLMAALLAFVPLVLSAPAAAGTLDQQQTSAAGTVSPVKGPNTQGGAGSRAQTFTAGLSGVLDQVDLHLSRQSSATTGPLTVEIRDVAGGNLPGETVLASAAVPAADVPLLEGRTWVPVTFATPAPVAAGAQYAIVAHTTGANFFNWQYSDADQYPAGRALASLQSPPVSWVTPSGIADQAFKTYVTTCPDVAPTGPVSPLVWQIGDLVSLDPVKQLACSLAAYGL